MLQQQQSITTWSAQQQAIFGWFKGPPAPVATRGVARRKPKRNLVVVARAGTGKTTTIIEAIRYAPERRILLAAFNRRIALELKEQLKHSNPNATAQTLHSVGLALVRQYWERIFTCERNERSEYLTTTVCGEQVPVAVRKLVSKLHTKGREIAPHAVKMGDLTELLYQFECDPEPKWADAGFDVGRIERWALQAMELAAGTAPRNTGIDFADMIFLPVRNGWAHPQYDLVVGDEAQDWTSSQLELAQAVCGGRFCLVGDDRQAIYGFRGADSDSLARLKAELDAEELKLTTTYRCGTTIVAYAATLVPDFEAGPTNPPGEILSRSHDQMLTECAPGDFILSRINAPLAATALALIRLRKRVKIAGRDIGSNLKTIIRKVVNGTGVQDVPTFLSRLQQWAGEEVERAYKANREERVDVIRDQESTLYALTDGAANVAEVERRIEELFSDDVGEGGYVTCSSVHKAKGLEATRVYVFRDTLYPKRKPAPGQPVRVKPAKFAALAAQEEQNIEYVAVTRAKRTLVWVGGAVEVEPPEPKLFDANVVATASDGSVVEASTLGLEPGYWPPAVTYQGIVYVREKDGAVMDAGGEYVSYRYTEVDEGNPFGGRSLTILND